jgi:hypothetical protein
LLAYRWASSPDQEATGLVEHCTNAFDVNLCRKAHGPFDVNTPLVSRTFNNLGMHTKLSLRLRYWMIDSWDYAEEGGVRVVSKQNVFNFFFGFPLLRP